MTVPKSFADLPLAGGESVVSTGSTDGAPWASPEGIAIKPAVGGSAQGVLTQGRSDNNANNGLRGDSTNGAVTIVIDDSSFSGNAQGVAMLGGASNLRAVINDTVIANNSGAGIVNSGANSTLRVGDTTITGNAQGIVVAGGAVLSYGTNRMDGNPTTGAPVGESFSGAAPPK